MGATILNRWLAPRRPIATAAAPGVRGFTLVESLIALLVLSIGLLGVAALQLTSLQANSGAFQRSQATFLAQDLADRMRANRQAALAQQYDFPFGTAAPVAPANTVQVDLLAFKTRLGVTLPAAASGSPADEPDASVVTNPMTGIVTISIRWDDSRGSDAPLTFTMRTRV
jgi:type IV pilus assembly protein PilV